MRKLLRHLQIAILSIFAFSCGMKQTNKATVFSEIALQDNSNSGFVYSLYSIDSHGNDVSYIGTVQRTSEKFEWPDAVNADIQARAIGAAKPVSYVVRAYSAKTAGNDGDYYYEAPVLTANPAMNGSATAIWWVMKSSSILNSGQLSVSPNTWQNILFTLETQCSNCMLRSASAVFPVLQGNQSLQKQLSSLWAIDSGGESLNPSVTNSPPVGVAWSSIPSLGMAVPTQPGDQGKTLNLAAVFYDPLNSTIPQFPDDWELSIGSSAEVQQGTNVESIQYFLDFDNSGSETFFANKTIRGIKYSLPFPYQVTIVHRPPVFSGCQWQYVGIPRALQANHRSFCTLQLTDPQSSLMNAVLGNAPTGVQWSDQTNFVLEWNPTTAQVGAFQINVVVVDGYGQSTNVVVSGYVGADQLPSFINPPATWSLIEAVGSSLSIATQDGDGDPIELFCSGCSFVSGFPNIAGWSSSTTYIYSGSMGSQSATIDFTPSYKQVVANPSLTANVTLLVSYPSSNPDLRSGPGSATSLTVNIQNRADVPIWDTQPTASISTTMFQSTANLTGGTAGGTAHDPTIQAPTPTVISYSISPLGQGASAGTFTNNCNWFTVDPVTAKIKYATGVTQTPEKAAKTCSFLIRASNQINCGDADGCLYTDSNSVTIHTTEVDTTGVQVFGSVPDQNVVEGTPFNFNVAPYFTDQNITNGDPNETLTYTCANCVALGIPVGNPATLPFGTGGFIFQGASMIWIPPFGTVTPANGSSVTISNIQIVATDNGGHSATQPFNLVVGVAVAPMALNFSSGSINVTNNAATVAANASPGTVRMNVTNLPNDGSSYPYSIAIDTSTSTNCRAGLTSYPATGSGVATYTVTISPIVSDGWAGSYASARICTLNYKLTDTNAGNSSVVTTGTFSLTINTSSTAPAGISMNGDNGGGDYYYTIDASIYKTYTINLSAINPADGTNDLYTYSTGGANPVGTTAGSSWNYNAYSNCAASNQTVTKNFIISALSSHGGSVNRAIHVTINNASSCN